jgi:hypothetical protein
MRRLARLFARSPRFEKEILKPKSRRSHPMFRVRRPGVLLAGFLLIFLVATAVGCGTSTYNERFQKRGDDLRYGETG